MKEGEDKKEIETPKIEEEEDYEQIVSPKTEANNSLISSDNSSPDSTFNAGFIDIDTKSENKEISKEKVETIIKNIIEEVIDTSINQGIITGA